MSHDAQPGKKQPRIGGDPDPTTENAAKRASLPFARLCLAATQRKI